VKKSPLIFLTFSLILIGVIFISISSLSEANSTIGDKFFFLKKQIFWLVSGIIVFIISSKIKIETVKKFSAPLYLFSIFTLLIVLIPGFGNQALGARRWLNLGSIGIQPSEILKFSSVIYFSLFFSKAQNRNIKKLIFYLAFPFLLIILEPNLSTAVLVSLIVISIYYLSGGEIMPLIGLSGVVILLSFLLIFTSPYRLSRFKTFISPQNTNANSSASYHSNQIILTIASGGFFGKGFANSDQKYKFLPKISTDSILAVIGEETGFLGISLIIIIYSFLIFYLFKLSQKIASIDLFSSLLIAGIACWITYQSLINMSAIAALIPLTGVPLPFISYGGSSLLALLSAIGLVRNIEKHHSLLIYSNNNDRKTVKKNNHHRHPLNSRH
jgi:cell division protein FtsW